MRLRFYLGRPQLPGSVCLETVGSAASSSAISWRLSARYTDSRGIASRRRLRCNPPVTHALSGRRSQSPGALPAAKRCRPVESSKDQPVGPYRLPLSESLVRYDCPDCYEMPRGLFCICRELPLKMPSALFSDSILTS